MNSRILDGMMGLCIGDALGVPVEFKSRASLRAKPVREMRGFGTYSQPTGTWSDDTSMTLCLAESLASRGVLDYQDIMNNFSMWLHEGRFTPHGKAFDVGRTTTKAIQRFDDGMEPRLCGGTSEFDNGNGSLMRILPLAYYLREEYGADFFGQPEAMDAIHYTSALTHAHLRSMLACGIYIAIANSLMDGDPAAKAVQSGLAQARTYYEAQPGFAAHWNDFARLADSSFASLPEGDIRSSGYVVDTLEAAVWCLLTSTDYRECVLKAVNLGEDTDTVAAVAGGLAGLAFGCAGLPEEWLRGLARRDMVEEACQRLAVALERIAVRRLCRFMPFLEQATSQTVCRGGTGNGVHDSPPMNEFTRAINRSILFDPDYPDLIGNLAFEHAQELSDLIETADLPLVRAILTGFVRQERFCAGVWAEALDEKVLHRMMVRLAMLTGVRDCLPTA